MTDGATYGIYFTRTAGSGNVIYSNGDSLGTVIASGGGVNIFSGYGKTYPFADNFSPRDFNGSITFASGLPAIPEPNTWAMMIAGFGLVGAGMRKRVSKVSFAAA